MIVHRHDRSIWAKIRLSVWVVITVGALLGRAEVRLKASEGPVKAAGNESADHAQEKANATTQPIAKGSGLARDAHVSEPLHLGGELDAHADVVPSPTNHLDIVPQDRPWEQLGGSNMLPASVSNIEKSRMAWFQTQLETARQHRRDKKLQDADLVLTTVLESDSPAEFKRSALYELALVAQEMNQLGRAQQILAQYLSVFPKDPAAPEIYLRQGLIYRQMGARQAAVTKFYAVMTTSLSLKLDRMDYYRRLVLQAKTEIADTYYMEGEFEQASQFFERLLRETSKDLNRSQILVKLIRSLSQQGRHSDVLTHADSFLKSYPEAAEFPEVRYLLAASLKKMDRNRDAMQQVLLLLDDQGPGTVKHGASWFYWRQRSGNDIANQMYREADYLNALQIYLSLVQLDGSPSWQFPVLYQIGLVYERLDQPQKASETYKRIQDGSKDLKPETLSPGLKAVVEMAQWRRDRIQWERTTGESTQDLKKLTSGGKGGGISSVR